MLSNAAFLISIFLVPHTLTIMIKTHTKRGFICEQKQSQNRNCQCSWCLLKSKQALWCLTVKHRHIHGWRTCKFDACSLFLNVWVENYNPWSFLYSLLKDSADINRLRFAKSTILGRPGAVILLRLPLRGLRCTLPVFWNLSHNL